MGNYQIVDAVLRTSEGILANGITKDPFYNSNVIVGDPCFDISSTDWKVFINNGNNNDYTSRRIAKNDYPSKFIVDSGGINAVKFKSIAKEEIAAAVYSVQQSKEFEKFLKKTSSFGVTTAVQLTNVLNSCVDNYFSPAMVTRNVAYATEHPECGSYAIDFVNGKEDDAFPNVLAFFAKQSVQNYYTACFANCILNTFIEDSSVSSIGGYLKQELINMSNCEKRNLMLVYILTFLAFVIGIISLVYIFIHMDQDRKNFKKHNEGRLDYYSSPEPKGGGDDSSPPPLKRPSSVFKPKALLLDNSMLI